MSSDALFSAANLLLPEVLVSHFDLTNHEIKNQEIHFYFTELNNVPEGFANVKLHSKGFFPEATIQGLRSKSCGICSLCKYCC